MEDGKKGLDRRTILYGAAGLTGLAAVGAVASRRGRSVHDRFVVVNNQMPTGIDYARLGTGVNSARALLENVTEPLVDKDAAGNPKPGLAEWSFSPDGKIVEFRLRRGVLFHNGMPFTAEDVLFSHERLNTYSALYRGRTKSLLHVEIVDDHRIRFHFSQPAIGFVRTRILFIFSRGYFGQVGEEGFSNAPVGTGPYRITDFRRFEHCDLDAFDDYWGGSPEVKRIRMAFVQEDMTRVAMLRSGEADLIMATPFPMVPVLERLGFARRQADMHPTFSVRFQLANKHTPWADLRVRQAVAHAINSDAIIKGLFGGIPPHYAGFAPGEEGYDPSLKPYSYDPALSRRLLAEAGYPDGFTLPLLYWSQSYYGIRETTEAVVLYLKAIGIQCEVSAIDSTQGLTMARSAAKDPNVRLATIAPALYASYSDPAEAMRQGYSDLSPYSWYDDPIFNAALRNALNSADQSERERYLRACSKRLYEDLPIIPIWNNVVVYMMRPGVSYEPSARDVPLLQLRNIRVA
jgi:peptide/nickel transport system substrate-binding protein